MNRSGLWADLSPLMDPKLFKMFFKERYRKLISAIKKKADVKVALHSCGSVAWVLDDLADAGFDVLHPLQGEEERFGDRISFYSNLRNQSVIPQGTPQEVTAEVKEKASGIKGYEVYTESVFF